MMPFPFASILIPLGCFAAWCAGVVALSGWSAIRMPQGTRSLAPQRLLGIHLCGLALMLALMLAVQLLHHSSHAWIQSIDDLYRLNYAEKWLDGPFLAPPDHKWLTGNFAILAGLLWFLRDPMLVVCAHSILSWGVLYFGLGRLAWILGLSPWTAVLAGGWLAWHPFTRGVGCSAMPDVLSWGLFILGSAFLIEGWRGNGRFLRAWLLSSVCMLLGNTLRFEFWLLSGFFWLGALGWGISRGGKPISLARWGPSIITLLPFMIPAIWMISSWCTFGDPLAFVKNNIMCSHYTWEGSLLNLPWKERELGGKMRDSLFLPSFFLLGVVPLLPLLLLERMRGRTSGGAAICYSVSLIWLCNISYISFSSGITANAWERIAVPSIAILLPLAGQGVIDGLDALRRVRLIQLHWRIGLAVATVLLFAAAVMHHTATEPFRSQSSITKWMDTDSIATGWRLRSAMRDGRLSVPHNVCITIWLDRQRSSNGEDLAFIYTAGLKLRHDKIWADDPPGDLFTAPRGELLLTAHRRPEEIPDNIYKPLIRGESYILWVRDGM